MGEGIGIGCAVAGEKHRAETEGGLELWDGRDRPAQVRRDVEDAELGLRPKRRVVREWELHLELKPQRERKSIVEVDVPWGLLRGRGDGREEEHEGAEQSPTFR